MAWTGRVSDSGAAQIGASRPPGPIESRRHYGEISPASARLNYFSIFLSVGQQMSDRVMQVVCMTKAHRFTNRFATPVVSYRAIRRVPRGLAMLRALRLRLAAESQPHLSQAEFRFSK
jgi:hypothetical protein